MDAKAEKFLEELSELTKKYGIEIGSCGCCDSMWLNDLTVERTTFIVDRIRYKEKEQRYRKEEIGEID